MRRIPFLNLILHVKFHYNFFKLSKISFYIICKFHVKYRCTPSLIRFITNFGFLCVKFYDQVRKISFFLKTVLILIEKTNVQTDILELKVLPTGMIL